jgi:hypothetical protein
MILLMIYIHFIPVKESIFQGLLIKYESLLSSDYHDVITKEIRLSTGGYSLMMKSCRLPSHSRRDPAIHRLLTRDETLQLSQSSFLSSRIIRISSETFVLTTPRCPRDLAGSGAHVARSVPTCYHSYLVRTVYSLIYGHSLEYMHMDFHLHPWQPSQDDMYICSTHRMCHVGNSRYVLAESVGYVNTRKWNCSDFCR